MVEKSRVTLHDVAALAGVSHQTVSRVINNSDHVRPETRERVEAAILELGYRPNAIARSMVSGSTHTLGCISPNLTDPAFANIIEGAQAEARRHGYFLLVGSASTVEDVQPLLDELLNRCVDGLLVLNARDDERYQMLLPLAGNGTPMVYIKNSPVDEPVSSVRCDDVKGGYLATQHLIDLGHREIALILGPQNEQCSHERLHGYKIAHQEAGLPLREELLIQGNWSARSGGQAVETLLKNSIPFSAVFAMNDRMAAGVLRSLREAGHNVPEDYSLVGYDNIPLSRLIDPPLSTVHQPLEEIGKESAQILIHAIQKNNGQPVDLCITPELIPRESSQTNKNSS